MFADPNGEPGLVDHKAYAFCVLEHLHRALKRRDVFAKGSDRWGDPRARLLDGEAWEKAKGDVVTALQLTEQPDSHLAELACRLDTAYRQVAARLPDNAALELVRDGERINLDRLDAEPEPPSLVQLRKLVRMMLPRVDLPDVLLDVHGWTGCFAEYTHISEARARIEDLPISVAAVLVAEACLGLVLNAVVLWTTRYMDLALGQLRQAGYPVRDEDVARLSPLGFKHLNFLGRYAFTTPTPGQLRALRDPSAIEDEEEDEE